MHSADDFVVVYNTYVHIYLIEKVQNLSPKAVASSKIISQVHLHFIPKVWVAANRYWNSSSYF